MLSFGPFTGMESVVFLIVSVYGFWRLLISTKNRRFVGLQIARKKRDLLLHRQKHAEIYQELGELRLDDPRNLQICRLSCQEIKACHVAYKSGTPFKIHPTPSCREILKVFCARALQLCEKSGINAVTEACYPEALEEAKSFDKDPLIPEHIPPLWGVPLSVKESVGQKGFGKTSGMVERIGCPLGEDSEEIKILREAGAICFVRSNVPQALMMCESTNQIYGATSLLGRPDRSTGGSSGGEGGLLMARASPLGIGTDIGGSLRIPAAYCGVVSFKPTPERMPQPKTSDKSKPIWAVSGPMSRRVGDCSLFLQAFWGDSPKRFPEPNSWKVGVFESDGLMEVCESGRRAVRLSVEALIQGGHEVKDIQPQIQPFLGLKVARFFFGILGREGSMRSLTKALGREELMPHYRWMQRMARMPHWLRKMVAYGCTWRGDRRHAQLLETLPPAQGWSADENEQLVKELQEYRSAFTDFMLENQLDFLLFPCWPLPALPHDQSPSLAPFIQYTTLANVLHFPAGSLPITRVLRSEESGYPKDPPDQVSALAQKTLQGSAGLSMSIQLMGLPHRDEEVLQGLADLEKLISASGNHPID